MGRQQTLAWTEARALIERQRREYLIARPGGGEDTPWEFPGGRIAAQESPEAGLRRLCRELLGIELEISLGQPPFVHNFGAHSVTYRYYVCAAFGDAKTVGYAEIRWVALPQLRDYVFDRPTQQVVDWLLEGPKPA